MIEGLSIGLSMASLLLSVVAICATAWALIEVYAFRRSTHNVQFVSAEDAEKEAMDDTILNKTLNTQEFKAMSEVFGQTREPKQ